MGQSYGLEEIAAESVRQELACLLADERFSRSQAFCRFLRYTVEETLLGHGEGLKEYLIGREVFERGREFDPRMDPIVRVQAARLRARLKEYYQAEGATHPVVIEFPKGGYTPLFRPRRASPEPLELAAHRGRRRLLWVGAALIVVVAAALAAWRLRPAARLEPASLTRITSDAGSTTFPAISRDGRWIAFTSDRGGSNADIWIQPARGGEPQRLTHHAAADITPDISPDGTQVVFRSNRDRGGLYVVSILGGAERRIADTGWRPRFSPDGSQIVYQAPSSRRGGDLYVIGAGGGEPRRVDIGDRIELGGGPIWTPDGRYLLFLGSDLGNRRLWDWWVAPREGGVPEPTGAAGRLARQGLPALDIHTVPGDWAGNDLVFSLARGPVANLWVIPFTAGGKRVSGPARQITFGTAHESLPRVSREGALVFASESLNSYLYSIPCYPPGAAIEPLRLTNDLALDLGFFRALTRFSARGRYLTFPSSRKGNFDVFVKNLETGDELPVAAGPGTEDQPLIAPDSSHLAYRSREASLSPIYLAQIGSQAARKVCDDCGEPNSWTSDGRRLLYTARGGLGLLELDSGRKAELFRQPALTVRHAALSPSQRWIALTVEDATRQGDRAFLLPFTGDRFPPGDQWTEVLQGFGVESLHWAPDGTALYFFSTKDDFRCLWRQPIRGDGRLAGPPAPVAHFHDNRRMPWSSWLAVTSDRLVFSLTEPICNLWSARLTAGR